MVFTYKNLQAFNFNIKNYAERMWPKIENVVKKYVVFKTVVRKVKNLADNNVSITISN